MKKMLFQFKKSKIRKAGVSSKVILSIILSLIFLVVFLFWFWQAQSFASDQSLREQCRKSVQIHALTNIEGVDITDLDCHTFNQTITLAVNEQNQDKILKIFADEMAGCWYQFLEGEKPLFKGTKTFCGVCSYLDFKDKGQQVSGLQQYLITHNVPGKNIKYIDYLAGYQTTQASDRIKNEFLFEADQAQDTLDTDKLYSVIFVFARGQDFISNLKHSFGTIQSTFGAGSMSGLGAVFLLSNPLGWKAAIAAGALTSLGGALFTFFAGEEPEWISLVILTEHDQAVFQQLGCQELITKS